MFGGVCRIAAALAIATIPFAAVAQVIPPSEQPGWARQQFIEPQAPQELSAERRGDAHSGRRRLPRGEDVTDTIAMRFLAVLLAGMTAIVLYVMIHDALEVSRTSIRIDSLACAGLLGLACASSLLKWRK